MSGWERQLPGRCAEQVIAALVWSQTASEPTDNNNTDNTAPVDATYYEKRLPLLQHTCMSRYRGVPLSLMPFF